MNKELNILNGKTFDAQSEDFKNWFNNNCLPKITFGNGTDSIQSCDEFDIHKRPKIWSFDDLIVEANYLTDDENYTFSAFIIYGRSI